MRDMIRNIVQKTINGSLSDIPVTVKLRSIQTGAYNPVTGTATRTITELNVKAVLANITQGDTNSLELITSGKKALVAGKDLVNINLDALDDSVEVDGELYELDSIKKDPVGALYSLMLLAKTPKTHGT